MSETLGEIQDRLRPDHLIQQAKDSVTEAATGKVRNIMHSAGETATMVADQTSTQAEPRRITSARIPCRWRSWPAASPGGCCAAAIGRTSGKARLKAGATLATAQTLILPMARTARCARRLARYASTARETVGEYASSARQTVSEAAEAARCRALKASERVSSAAQTASVRAQETWRSASTSVDSWVHEYPLAAGAIAVAVGAAVGLRVPSPPRSRTARWARSAIRPSRGHGSRPGRSKTT